jgi:Ca2+/Na+ antiporter
MYLFIYLLIYRFIMITIIVIVTIIIINVIVSIVILIIIVCYYCYWYYYYYYDCYIYNFKTNFTIMDVDNRLTSTWRHGVTWPRQLHTSQLFLVGPFRCWLRTKQHSQACELNHHLAHGPKMSKN